VIDAGAKQHPDGALPVLLLIGRTALTVPVVLKIQHPARALDRVRDGAELPGHLDAADRAPARNCGQADGPFGLRVAVAVNLKLGVRDNPVLRGGEDTAVDGFGRSKTHRRFLLGVSSGILAVVSTFSAARAFRCARLRCPDSVPSCLGESVMWI